MKRLLFAVILLLSITSSKAQSESYWNAVEINYKFNNTWSGWKTLEAPIFVILDFDAHRVVIHSNKIQIIDHAQLRHYSGKDYDLYTAVGTDSDYLSIELNLYLYKTFIVVKIIYPDYEYKYKIIPRPDN